MPYSGERAWKGWHSDLIRNPDVSEFLENCEYMKEPGEQEGKEISLSYLDAPMNENIPSMIIASDASVYSDAINGKFPSTQIGYIKISLMLINIEEYWSLKNIKSRFVDPFKVASIHRKATPISFILPGSNIRYKWANSVSNGFRRAVFDQYSSEQTNFRKDWKYTLVDTLLSIYWWVIAPDKCKCPSCNYEGDNYQFSWDYLVHKCSHCAEYAYITDVLRLHEQIGDHTDSSSPITRFMNVTEHLLIASFIRWMSKENPKLLSDMWFIIDGPLAIFWEPAKIHAKLQSFYFNISSELKKLWLNPPIIMGLQKEWQIMEHARALNKFLIPNSFRIVDDSYRESYINWGKLLNDNFWHETYYWQDFIFKTNTGRIFSVAVPYPFVDKSGGKKQFSQRKSDTSIYLNQLSRAFDLIRYFELDLYENAIVPVALAHRHASISVVPGGRVLDILSHTGLKK